jgi:DNA-binding Xre family transcriptional regulator
MEMIQLDIEKIEELRLKHNIRSQAELARRSNWDIRHLNRIYKQVERGETPNVTLSKLNELCNVLHCKVSTILIHEFDPAK